LLLAARVDSAVTVTFRVVGPDVVATYRGALNLSGLPAESLAVSTTRSDGVWPDLGKIGLGAGDRMDVYTGISGPSSFGGDRTIRRPSESTGGFFGFNMLFGRNQLLVPAGYVSGNNLEGSTTWYGSSLDEMGLTNGSFQWTWGAGADSDAIELRIVPEPNALLLTTISIAAFLIRRR
jgi:hypothetical protein